VRGAVNQASAGAGDAIANAMVGSIIGGVAMGPIMTVEAILEPIGAVIKFRDDQLKKLHDLRAEMAAELAKVNELPVAERPEATMKALKELDAKYLPRMLAMLTPDQRERFRGIQLQLQGPNGLLDPEIAAKLNLTVEQREQITQIVDELALADDPEHAKLHLRSLRIPRVLAKRAAADAKAHEVLTPEQQKTYTQLLGPKLPLAKLMHPEGKH
jgi:Spy/CpxP family protein refolding chaperone